MSLGSIYLFIYLRMFWLYNTS